MYAANRVKETTTVEGTASVVLGGAASSDWRQFRDVPSADGRPFEYLIEGGSEREWGLGTFTQGSPDTLSRDTVFGGTNGTSKVDFSPGSKTVSVVSLAEFMGSLGGALFTALTSGTSTAYTANLYPAPPLHIDYMRARVKFHDACGANPTFAANGLSALALKKAGGTALAAGDIPADSVWDLCRVPGGWWEIVGAAPVAAASATGAGTVELATNTEALAGSDTARALTPANAAAIYGQGSGIADAAAITIPTTGGSYFVVAGTTTVTSIALAGGDGTIPAGRTVLLRFSGARQITHNATSLILQNAANKTVAAGDLMEFVYEGSGNWRQTNHWPATVASNPSYESGNITITAGATGTLTHGLGGKPKQYDAYLVCTAADLNYSVGEEVPVGKADRESNNNFGVILVPGTSSIFYRFGSRTAVFRVNDKNTGASSTDIDPTKWVMVVRARLNYG